LGFSRPPEARPTTHHQPAQPAITTKPPPAPRAGSGWPMPSRRTLTTGIHALRWLVGNRASPSWLRSVSQRQLDWHRPPLANPDSMRRRVGKGYRHLASLGASPLFHRSPPARAGGTAGRWAFPGPRKPAESFTTNPPNPRSPPNNKPTHVTPRELGTRRRRGSGSSSAGRACPGECGPRGPRPRHRRDAA